MAPIQAHTIILRKDTSGGYNILLANGENERYKLSEQRIVSPLLVDNREQMLGIVDEGVRRYHETNGQAPDKVGIIAKIEVLSIGVISLIDPPLFSLPSRS